MITERIEALKDLSRKLIVIMRYIEKKDADVVDFMFMSIVIVLLMACAMLSSCERRELYVYGDEFHDAFLEVDWRHYDGHRPDGMTAWFYPGAADFNENKPYRHTTADVDHYDLYLSGGLYQGMVIDYSPEEFGKQQFLGIDTLHQARVEALPLPEQPELFDSVYAKLEVKVDSIDYTRLYGDSCWHYPDSIPVTAKTGYHVVTNEPEYMVLDTLKDMLVDKGLYGDYIPWEARNTYQSTLKVTGFYAEPKPIVQKLLIRVFVRGIQYLWQTEGTLAGLSKGHYLVDDYNTEDPCLMDLKDWNLQVVNDSLGYIYTTINTFGLRPSTIDGYYSVHDGSYKAPETRAEDRAEQDSIWWVDSPFRQLRLNLRFTLRDHARVMEYSYDVGDQVVKFDNEYYLLIDLNARFFGTSYGEKGDPGAQGAQGEPGPPGPPGPAGADGQYIYIWVYPPPKPEEEEPDLPYVPPYNGTGFDAEVTPWIEMPSVEVNF